MTLHGTIPDKGEFRAANERIIDVRHGPDGMGRWTVTMYWLDDYLPPDGIRGQVFSHATVDWFRNATADRTYVIRLPGRNTRQARAEQVTPDRLPHLGEARR